MKLQIKSTFDLKPYLKYPFEIWFTMNWRRKEDYWFTPTGKCKVNADQIRTNHLTGRMSDEDYNSIMAEMKKSKCDVLTNEWENTFYTTGDKTLIELPNLIGVLDRALEEWNVRFAEL